MNRSHEKIVDFKFFCKLCQHKNKTEWDEPCDSCLEHPVNVESHKPLYFKDTGEFEKTKKSKSKAKGE